MIKQMQSKKGQTLVEYALIVALLSVMLIAGLQILEGKVSNTFDEVQKVMP